MLEKLGRKFVRGAKAELTETSGFNRDKILNVVVKIAEAGLFLGIIFLSGRSERLVRTPVIVIHNHIHKE